MVLQGMVSRLDSYVRRLPTMPGVFVSHAAADKQLVDEFVDTILRAGCELGGRQIFYSSGEDTGVPSGSDLLSHIRKSVGEADLVIAVISPSFQTRPFCVAELGAAWGRTDNLFPLAVPGMERPILQGVLEGMTVRYLNDSGALDELHDRVGEVAGAHVSSRTWGRYRAKWLTNVDRLVSELPTLRAVTLAEIENLERELADIRVALRSSEQERAELVAQMDEVSKTRSTGMSSDEARQALRDLADRHRARPK